VPNFIKIVQTVAFTGVGTGTRGTRKEMDIKLNAVDYKIWGIMQGRVYARKITSVDELKH